MPDSVESQPAPIEVVAPSDVAAPAQSLLSAIREALRGSHRDYTSGPIGRPSSCLPFQWFSRC